MIRWLNFYCSLLPPASGWTHRVRNSRGASIIPAIYDARCCVEVFDGKNVCTRKYIKTERRKKEDVRYKKPTVAPQLYAFTYSAPSCCFFNSLCQWNIVLSSNWIYFPKCETEFCFWHVISLTSTKADSQEASKNVQPAPLLFALLNA